MGSNHRPALYQVSSSFEYLHIWDMKFRQVVVNWFKRNRSARPVPYGEWIDSYKSLDWDERVYAERFIDGLFTKSEAERLEKFLMKHQGGAFKLSDEGDNRFAMTRVTLPVSGQVTRYDDLPDGRKVYDYYNLSEHPDYNLPFDVYGYLDLFRMGKQKKLRQGAAYLHRALQMLDLDAGIKFSQLEAIAEVLYERDRIFIAQEPTHQSWLHKVELPQETG